MHLAIGTVLQQVFTFKQPPKIQFRNTAIILGILVPFVIYRMNSPICGPVSQADLLLDCVTDEFVLHVILFFCMSWIVAGKVRILIREQIKDAGQYASTRMIAFGAAC